MMLLRFLSVHKPLGVLVITIGEATWELRDLVQAIKRPPVIRQSTKVFLRMYPDVFHMTTNLNSGFSTVKLNKTLDPPLYL